ncbi:unnamed protein product [Polarella glacialis]|uniref:Calcineurin-like phosphoesterase domain-containing protein n=1 Tax=Polarella glacialis TaxID=89957 RepID=A0A813LFC7_POLGL|nr:unnamed protein product [Polarella glacialis]
MIGYVTDIEGDAVWWRRYVELSEVLHLHPDDGIVRLADGAHFVFGGDAVDHKPGSLRVLQDLLDLKRRYPERVHLLLGNRDICKLRLWVELGELHGEQAPLRSHPGVYWHRASRPCQVLSDAELSASDSAAAAVRLHWILKHTMGASQAFESRRAELSGSCGEQQVGDDEVVRSFRDSVMPGGAMFEYLRCGKLAVRLGSTLFLHAGLPRQGSTWRPGWVPGWEDPAAPDREGLPLTLWIEALEDLRAAALAECEAAHTAGRCVSRAWSTEGGYCHEQPGSALLQYGMRDMPSGERQPSVIYNGWLSEDLYQPMQPDDATLVWLREGGVRHVVTGHLPHGDAPLFLPLAEDIFAVSADTSFAGSVQWPSVPLASEAPVVSGEGPTRGQSVCEVLVDELSGALRVHGVLSQGVAFEATSPGDSALGRETTDGWRVKGRVGDGELLLCRNVKWDFENRIAHESDVELV